ncbi:DUF726 domain-containing protein [Rhodococcus hoagii]|nr:DUF726 domain-containing protein [Prescottella equi]
MAAKKLAPIAPALLVGDLAKNPWHTAVVRADRTGVALAGILARTKVEGYILVGHSLGARAMITAAETLGTSKDARRSRPCTSSAPPRQEGRLRPLSEAVAGTVNNYYSTNDGVLKYMYAAAQAGSVAVACADSTANTRTSGS